MALWELWGFWPDAGDEDNPRDWKRRALIGLRFPLFLFAVAGAWVGRHDWRVWACFIPIAAITLVHTAFFSTSRFTYTVEPLAMVLAVTAFCKLMARK